MLSLVPTYEVRFLDADSFDEFVRREGRVLMQPDLWPGTRYRRAFNGGLAERLHEEVLGGNFDEVAVISPEDQVYRLGRYIINVSSAHGVTYSEYDTPGKALQVLLEIQSDIAEFGVVDAV